MSIYRALRNSYVRHGLLLTRHLKDKCFVILVKDNIDKNVSLNQSAKVKRNVLIVLDTLIQHTNPKRYPHDHLNIQMHQKFIVLLTSALLRLASTITLN